MKPTIVHASSFVDQAAKYVLDAANQDLQNNGRFVLSLCGGNTPKPIYRKLAEMGKSLKWKDIIITFGDERCVPPDHQESNFRMAKDALLDTITIPSENVIRMHGELLPEKAAEICEAELRQISRQRGENVFVHDLMLLGVGGDGHTASLFPETGALSEQKRWVVSNHVQKLNSDRLTFTYPLINAARRVCFLVNDDSKKLVIDNILSGSSNYPAGRVRGVEETMWLLGY